MTLTSKNLLQTLEQMTDPHSGSALRHSVIIRQLELQSDRLLLKLEPGYPMRQHEIEVLADCIRMACQDVLAERTLDMTITPKIAPHAVRVGVKLLAGVKNVIAIASGKGGVGKSTTTVNLALALHQQGARVGVLDADVYGPSIPQMLGIGDQQPQSEDDQGFSPLIGLGLQAMSVGFLVGEDAPMIWRGPMATQALSQLAFHTHWQALDYLLVDLPPGTGDIQLTLAQKVPLTGALIVTTPQDIALLDARKGLKMFEKMDIPVLGVVENMSLHVCSNCGHSESIFGEGGGERLCADYGVSLLGRLPLDIRIRTEADRGCPTVVAAPESEIAQQYNNIARALALAIAARPKDHSHHFPKIVVQNKS